MNDDPPEDDALRHLRPAAPSAELMARLRAAAPEKGRIVTLHRRRWAAGMLAGTAAAAAVVIFSGPGQPEKADTPSVAEAALPEGVFLPVEARSVLIDAEPVGVVQLPNQPPVRVLRTVWLDDVTAAGADPAARVQWLQRREQYVPVSSTLY